MTSGHDPREHRVLLPVRIHGGVPEVDAAALVDLLLERAPAGSWSSVSGTSPDGADVVHLEITIVDTEASAAVQRVVDGVRGLLGLDAQFARWVVDARGVQVEDLPR